MPRLFVAVDLPEDIIDRIGSLQEADLGAKWVNPETMHLTLRFIGDVPRGQMKEIEGALEAINHDSFELQPQGLGVFPSRRNPRVLWVGLADQPRLQELQSAVDETVVQQGGDPEDRSFTPHITFGRVRGSNAKRIRNFMQEHSDFQTSPVRITEFHLYRSKLKPDGARHFVEHTYPLGQAE